MRFKKKKVKNNAKKIQSSKKIGKNNSGKKFWFLNFDILIPKLFWPTVRKNCSCDRETLLKFKAEGQEFAKFLKSIEQFIQAVKGQNNFGNRMLF